MEETTVEKEIGDNVSRYWGGENFVKLILQAIDYTFHLCSYIFIIVGLLFLFQWQNNRFEWGRSSNTRSFASFLHITLVDWSEAITVRYLPVRATTWMVEQLQNAYLFVLIVSFNNRYEIWKQIIDLSDVNGEQNAYKVLDLSPTASQSEITSRWRALSREHHPDKFKDPVQQRVAQEKFMEIQQAYEILSNIKTKRKRKNKKSVEWFQYDWLEKSHIKWNFLFNYLLETKINYLT